MKVALKDGAPRSAGTVEVNVSKNGNTLEIGATGVEPAPIVLEFYDSKLTLRVYGENGQPNVSQQIRTVPNVKPEPASNEAMISGGTPSAAAYALNCVEEASKTFAAPPDFDEAAFDAA
jgi:hypothetical protein